MNDAELKPFVETYVLANTPDFLLARILTNPALKGIVETCSSDTLLKEIQEADQGNGVLKNYVRGYVATVALLKHAETSPEVAEPLRAYAPHLLRWIPAMLVQWDALRKPTTEKSAIFPPQLLSADDRNPSTSTITTKGLVLP